jgi:hypothetical protein
MRIDLFLKQFFFNVFDPTKNMILFPTICWVKNNRCDQDPRVNETVLFIPKNIIIILMILLLVMKHGII